MTFRSCGVILQKLLALRGVEWTDDGATADLYIVPYFAKSDCMEGGRCGEKPCFGRCKCAQMAESLRSHLTWYHPPQPKGPRVHLKAGEKWVCDILILHNVF